MLFGLCVRTTLFEGIDRVVHNNDIRSCLYKKFLDPLV
jgi:hypothetical protein